ncbi:MAG: hypothetical protein KKE62_07320 [Proteobacteria bacterium]|nr:hypothetical protein [Pseudomonadota bacterium]MBU1389702.1 hypothetical protein [Pseudomonadota bacterium]MBU1542640.1 hypothetical protein [Pseudomonadota bacterium]MBU2429486.1 hypothetical protein [Pseudomonadota bacterium]MBU2479532.1 hypothetical protein [Pseudomonadota bacterium]
MRNSLTYPEQGNNIPVFGYKFNPSGVCMKGNIYTRQKCTICENQLIHDERRGGCFCESHPEIQAGKEFYIKFGKEINKRFRTYERAYHYLIGLRYEVEQNKFDARDHMASQPLSFMNLSKEYLKFKEKQKLITYRSIERYLNKASEFFGHKNVKEINKKEINHFLESLGSVSDKTKANYASQIRDFFYNFLYEEEEILNLIDLPKMPKIRYELGFRNIIDIETREKIVERFKERTYEKNPKLWLAIDILCAYNNLRPGDLPRLKEGDINLEYGVLTFWRPTKSKQKKNPPVIRIRLLDYHIDEIKALKQQYPATENMPFFRHTAQSGKRADTPLSENYLYKQWKKACSDLEIHDLDLYGGTRHSTTTATAMELGKDSARKFSAHHTDKAFDRYCQIGDEETFDTAQIMAKRRGKIIEIDKRKKENK